MIYFLDILGFVLKESQNNDDIVRSLLLGENEINITYNFENTPYYSLGLYSIKCKVNYSILDMNDLYSVMTACSFNNGVIDIFMDGGTFVNINFSRMESIVNFNIMTNNIPINKDECFIDLDSKIKLCTDMSVYSEKVKCLNYVDLDKYIYFKDSGIRKCIYKIEDMHSWIVDVNTIDQLQSVYITEPYVFKFCDYDSLQFNIFCFNKEDFVQKMNKLEELINNDFFDRHLKISIHFKLLCYEFKDILEEFDSKKISSLCSYCDAVIFENSDNMYRCSLDKNGLLTKKKLS